MAAKGPEAPAPSDRLQDTLGRAESRYGDAGFTGRFVVRPGGRVGCLACNHDSDPGDVAMLALRRLEGPSDPSEEMAVVAIQCPVCDTRGTLTLAYGSMAPADDSQVLSSLADDRGMGRIGQGS